MTEPSGAVEAVELLPCPFCGRTNPFSGTTLDDSCYVVCGNDDCSGMVGYFPSIPQAVEAWSTRATPSAQEHLVETIVKVRDGYASQAKFCDIEALGYFREFIRRIDEVLLTCTEKSKP